MATTTTHLLPLLSSSNDVHYHSNIDSRTNKSSSFENKFNDKNTIYYDSIKINVLNQPEQLNNNNEYFNNNNNHFTSIHHHSSSLLTISKLNVLEKSLVIKSKLNFKMDQPNKETKLLHNEKEQQLNINRLLSTRNKKFKDKNDCLNDDNDDDWLPLTGISSSSTTSSIIFEQKEICQERCNHFKLNDTICGYCENCQRKLILSKNNYTKLMKMNDLFLFNSDLFHLNCSSLTKKSLNFWNKFYLYILILSIFFISNCNTHLLNENRILFNNRNIRSLFANDDHITTEQSSKSNSSRITLNDYNRSIRQQAHVSPHCKLILIKIIIVFNLVVFFGLIFQYSAAILL